MNRHINEHGSSWRRRGTKGGLSLLVLTIATALTLTAGVPVALSAGPTPTPASAPFRPGVVLVGFHQGVSTGERYAIERAVGVQGARHLGPSIKQAGRGDVVKQELLSPLELRVPLRLITLDLRQIGAE